MTAPSPSREELQAQVARLTEALRSADNHIRRLQAAVRVGRGFIVGSNRPFGHHDLRTIDEALAITNTIDAALQTEDGAGGA